MLLKSKLVLAVAVIAMSLVATGCEEDPPPEEPVQPDVQTEPEPPPEPEPVVDTYNAEAIYFAFDDYSLGGDAKAALSNLAEYLKTNPSAFVQIEGHCDERGTNEYNLALGDRRANSVRDHLIDLGVTPDRLSTISYGEEKPAMDGSNEQAWSQNRRAEFVISGS
jgi:peptidoglycan-associated lipoprotein